MTYVIGFNGPPHCGKDTVANALQELLSDQFMIPTVRDALSLPMRLVGFTMLGYDYDETQYGIIKDVKQDLLVGDTLRQFMISYSEKFIKPRYGHSFWARQLRQRCPMWGNGNLGILIVSDIGFADEVAFFETNTRDYLQVNLTREGADSWEKDSRSYVTAHKQTVIPNNGTPQEAAGHVISAILRAGWTL